ncbi:MAG: nucleotide exchange factor GrpE [Lachnospiraceae bacterium]|nr:nucleotide exchange factor GrpE [Lachnospiraceae bacterium]
MAKFDKRKQNAGKNADTSGETVNLFREEEVSAEEETTDAAASSEVSEEIGADNASDTEANVTSGENNETAEEAAAEAEVTEGSEAEAKEEAGKKKEAKKDKRDEKIAELNDKVLRQQAEFINFRNRTEKEKAQMFEVGAKSAFEKILPVIDNFERGLATLSEEEKEQPFASGIDKTYRQLLTALAEAGVTPIEAVGQPFDPELHNAVMHVEDDTVGENIVVEEFQKGYKYRDSVLRHSMVKVAN